MTEYLAKVTQAGLKMKDSGILFFNIEVEYDNYLNLGLGGKCYSIFDNATKKEINTGSWHEMIRRLFLLFDVNISSEMKNKIIYVIGEGESFNFKPEGFRSPFKSENNTLIFDEIFNKKGE